MVYNITVCGNLDDKNLPNTRSVATLYKERVVI